MLSSGLHSTRETELAERFPLHVVTAWMGNSELVAAKHYLQVTDDHFSKAVRNPVQQPAEMGRKASRRENRPRQLPRAVQGVAVYLELLPVHQVAEEELEPSTDSSKKTTFARQLAGGRTRAS